MRRERSRSTRKGRSTTDLPAFSTVEVILAATIFAMIVTAFIGALLYGQEATALGGNRARAVLLAEEGLEAARNIRDAGYANLTDGTYGLAVSSGQWIFSGAQDATGTFTRRVTVSSVDTKRKLITSAVTWQQNAQRTGTVTLTSRLTNWLAQAAGNWANAFQESSMDAAGNNDGTSIATQGNFAYLIRSGGTPNFLIFDVTTPTAPVLRGSLTLTGTPTEIAVSGGYAYVSNQSNTQELQIIDVSVPTAPVLAGSYDAPGNANALGVAAVGSTVYLVRASSVNNEFLIINANIPSAPALLGSLNLGTAGNDVAIVGNYAYVATANINAEVQAINVAIPTAPVLAGSLNLPGAAAATAIAGYAGGLFVSQGSALYTASLAAPAAPVVSGTIDAGGNINDITMGQGNAYVFLGTSNAAMEFQAVDVSTLAAPARVGFVNVAGTSPVYGIAYNPGLDRAFGASAANTMEFVGFAPQ